MKKFTSLLLTAVLLAAMLTVFAVPASAASKSKFGTDYVTGELYEEFTFFYFSDIPGVNYIFVGQNFMIETNKHAAGTNEIFGGDKKYYTKVYPKEGSDFYITRVEARITSYPKDYGYVGVTAGTKFETWVLYYNDIVHVDNINSKEFAFAGGTDYVGFDMVRVYYECAGEHAWDENDKCEICGIPKCKVTGEHNAVLVCSDCGKKLSEEVIPSQNAPGSTLSGGYPEIVFAVGGLAVGFVVAMLIFRKKKSKPVPVEGAANEDEE